MKKTILFLSTLIVALMISRQHVVSVFNSVSQAEAAKRIIPIYSVKTDEKKVALSFDAAWGADDTDTLLEILAKHNVKATFFLVGDWVRKYPEEVKRIASAGHDIGNHSDKHPHMASMSKEQIKEDVMRAHDSTKELLGMDMNLFRPPFGEYNNTVMGALKECGYYIIQWDVDSLDWKEYGVQPLIDAVLKHKSLGNGSIILMHNNAKYTKDALESIIIGLTEQGYEMVPLSELIVKENYTIDHTGRQHRVGPAAVAD